MARSRRVDRSFAQGVLLCVLVVLALAGCGGGGGSAEGHTPPSSTPPTPSPAVGSATVNWQPPTQNVDGSALTDLAGYRIQYGTSRDALDQMAEIPNPGVASYMIENLEAGTWYFGVRAYTGGGAESDLSTLGSKTIP